MFDHVLLVFTFIFYEIQRIYLIFINFKRFRKITNLISWSVALLLFGLSFFFSFIISVNYSKTNLIRSTKENPIKLEHLNLYFKCQFTQNIL